jgi:flagellar biosynthetic protein FliR
MIDLAAEIPRHAFAFMLALARAAGAVALLPGLGEAGPPPILRAGFAACLACLLAPAVLPAMPAAPEAGIEAASMVAAEAATGLWFGWLARMLALALPMAAQWAAYLLGLSSVLNPDPELGAQTTALSRLFEMAAPVAVLSTGLYQLPLAALAGLYAVVPPGRWLPGADGAEAAAEAAAASLALAARLVAPFVLASVAFSLATGLLARLAPRLQIYYAALPGQILGGFALLAALAGAMMAAWAQAARGGFAALPGMG